MTATPAPLMRRALLRNLLALGLAAALVLTFAAVHGEWSPMHRWNRAFGDASLVLVALAMGLGPLARLLRVATPLLALRRELGVQACLLALVHATIILLGWVQLDLMRLFGFEFHPGLGRYVMVQPGFGLANAIGLVALVVAAVLALTSNDISVRRMGASAWKFLQMGVLPLWWLAVAHTAYFMFAHFLSFHRMTPEPNPLQWPFVALVLLVLALRGAAFVQTLRRAGARPDAPPPGPTPA